MSRPPFLRLSAALSGLLMAGALSAPPAAAVETEPVNIIFCDFFGTGTLSVDAGPAELFLDGWFTGTRGQLVHWVNSQTSTLTIQVDGAPATTQDVTHLWTAPVRGEEGGWFSILVADAVLAPGTVTMSMTSTWSKPTADFFPASGDHPMLVRGDTHSATCVLTVT